MFKHLIIILLLLSCIAPAFAANTTCPTCPTCPPEKVVYVTVTIPVPVPVTQQPTTAIKPIVTTEPSLIEYLSSTPELLIYGVLFIILIAGIIMMWRKNKKGKPPAKVEKIDELDLFEDDPPKKYVEVPMKPEVKTKLFIKKSTPKDIQKIQSTPEEKQESKKLKKPKSLLDQDFEF